MEFEFDKEIDALLRQAARGETVSLSGNPKSEIQNPKPFHLDADEISLFAESALTEKTKALYTQHFADCARCRKILSNVIALDSESVKESIGAPQAAKISSIVPWYRRLFALPNMGFASGAFLLAFAALVAFTLLKSSGDSQNAEIARVESTEKMSGPNIGEETQIIESNASAMSNGGSMMTNSVMSNSGSAMSNSAVSSSAMSNSGSLMSDSSAVSASPVVSPNSGAMSNGASASNSSAASNKRSDADDKTSKNEALNAAVARAKTADAESLMSSADFTPQTKREASEEKMRRADGNEAIQSNAPAPKSVAPPAKTRPALAELPVNGRATSSLNSVSARKSKSDVPETRAAGGKTFRRENGIWYDAGYGGQTTTNVSRGSEDFKKLDGGLRSIAGNLSGTIVIIWKGKAYRIQ